MNKAPDIFRFISPQGTIAVRVSPKASANRIVIDPGPPEFIRVYVTTVPAEGKANAMVTKLLAKALGVAKSRLVLRRGAGSKEKVFVVE